MNWQEKAVTALIFALAIWAFSKGVYQLVEAFKAF